MSRTEAPRSPVRVRLARGIEMEFRWIPAGDFVMGSRGEYHDEEPRHHVRIGRGFYLGRTAVTQAQFGAWTTTQEPPGGSHQNEFSGRPQDPAENLSWHDALAFCGWLNDPPRREREGMQLPAGCVATLPTEVEWEYACLAGTDTEYYTGDGETALGEAGWYSANSGSETHPVAERMPNRFGLYDMHGNVWEWCWDAWHADTYRLRVDGVVDPGSRDREALLRGVVESVTSRAAPDRVVRGGSWYASARNCRAAFRGRGRPGFRFGFRGFRVCLVPDPQSGQDPDLTRERVGPRGPRPARVNPSGA